VGIIGAEMAEMDRECRLGSQSALQGQDGVTLIVNFPAARAVSGKSHADG